MISLRLASLLVGAVSLLACGGIVGESGDPSPSPAPSPSPSPAPTGSGMTDRGTPDAGSKPKPASGVVWVEAEASSFDPRACSPSPETNDFSRLSEYVASSMHSAGFAGAAINAGGGACAFGTMPTTLSERGVYAGTIAKVEALEAAPLAPFRGDYLAVPIVVKEIASVRFAYYVGDGDAHAFDDVWVHQGLAFDDELAFMNGICMTKASFDAAIATSPMGDAVTKWLAAKGEGTTYRLGYDATLTFGDGSTKVIANANEAISGPYRAPCPNVVASP